MSIAYGVLYIDFTNFSPPFLSDPYVKCTTYGPSFTRLWYILLDYNDPSMRVFGYVYETTTMLLWIDSTSKIATFILVEFVE